jgi:hypothetical protein
MEDVKIYFDCKNPGSNCTHANTHDESSCELFIWHDGLRDVIIRLCKEQIKNKDTWGWLDIKPYYVPSVSQRQETVCKQCRRMNDVGVGSCWWCGCEHPTAINYKKYLK